MAYVHANKLMVSTDVSGLVESVNVHEGQQVKAGDILFTLDPKPFQIALDNAKAKRWPPCKMRDPPAPCIAPPSARSPPSRPR